MLVVKNGRSNGWFMLNVITKTSAFLKKSPEREISVVWKSDFCEALQEIHIWKAKKKWLRSLIAKAKEKLGQKPRQIVPIFFSQIRKFFHNFDYFGRAQWNESLKIFDWQKKVTKKFKILKSEFAKFLHWPFLKKEADPLFIY